MRADVACISTRMESLEPPLTIVCGVFLFIVSVVTAVGNTLVLVVIVRMNNKRSRSTVILSSLAVSDLLVGTVLGPITAWQQLYTADRRDCVVDMVRAYFVVLLVGSSVLTLAIVSYDRYLLLTKFNNYEKHMTRVRAALLIGFTWCISALMPILRFINKKAYLINIFILFVAPLFILATCYFFIMRAVHKTENLLRARQTPSSSGRAISEDELSSQQTSEATPGANNEQQLSVKKTRKHIRLARTVAILSGCYIACIIPMNVWIAIEMVKSHRQYGYQVAYVFAMMMMQVNSCINPFIYFSRNPDFRRGLERLFNVNRQSSRPRIATTPSSTAILDDLKQRYATA